MLQFQEVLSIYKIEMQHAVIIIYIFIFYILHRNEAVNR